MINELKRSFVGYLLLAALIFLLVSCGRKSKGSSEAEYETEAYLGIPFGPIHQNTLAFLKKARTSGW